MQPTPFPGLIPQREPRPVVEGAPAQRETRAGGARAWKLLLGTAPIFAAGYLSLPNDGPARTIAYPIFGIVAAAAILLGSHRNRPTRPGAWLLIGGGLALFSVGDVTYSLIALADPDVPYPSLADVAYLSAYLAIVVGVRRLVRGRMLGGDRMPVLDGAILAAGAASLLWLVVIQPSLVGAVDALAAAVSLSYPCLDLILLGLIFRVLLSSDGRGRSLQLLAMGLGLYFAADTIYAVTVLDGTYVNGHAVDALWIVGVTVIAAASLHPSAADPISSVTARAELGPARLALLGIAALLAPVIILIISLAHGDDDIVGLVITWTILFGLVLIRLASTVDELAASLLQRRRLQDDLRFQAEHDPLTQLANRTLFERSLGEALARAPWTTGLVFVDLDDFKAINDSQGHESGDEILRVVAERIRRDLRSSDLAARLGGDEFAVLLTGCSDEAAGVAVAERVLASLRGPVELGGRPFQVHASAGVAFGRPGATPIELMRDADVAMYQAKSHGKDKAEPYRAEVHRRIVRSYELRTELAQAIQDGQFVLEFQPAVDASEQVVGAEALVRWRHPERGLLPPAEFIALAESSGLIRDLGRWILREACRVAAGWPARPDGRPVVVSVNLAACQLLDPSLVDDVRQILEDTGVAPGRLFLEVTESALVELEPAAEALAALRGLGVRLALDDFGTGYSSLSYLTKLPFDVVKIDRAFVASLGTDPRVEALLAGIVGLCRNVQLLLCAEGVETEAQLQIIRRLGFEAAQGFLFAKPMAAGTVPRMLAAGADRRMRGGRLVGTVGPSEAGGPAEGIRPSAA